MLRVAHFLKKIEAGVDEAGKCICRAIFKGQTAGYS